MNYEHQKKVLREKLLEKPRSEWNEWIKTSADIVKEKNPDVEEQTILSELHKFAATVSAERSIDEFKPLSTEQLLDTLGLTIKRDAENKLLTFLCELSAYSENAQLNISFNAPSSTGKSYIPTEIAHLFPKEDVIEVGYCSPTAFFHDVGTFNKEKGGYTVDLERKILIFLDQPHTLLLQHLRPLLSHDEKEIQIKITDKSQKSGLKTKNIFLRGFPAVIFCTAKVEIDEQESTRFILLSPETHQEKIREAVIQKIKKETKTVEFRRWLNEHPERLALKERILAIKYANITEVRITNSDMIERLFFENAKHLKPRHSRDMGRIISLIQALTLLNWNFRERDGSSIAATDADIEEAFRIWATISESQELNLPPFVYRVYCEVIEPAWMEKLQGENQGYNFEGTPGLTRQEIARKHLKVYGRAIPDWLLRQQYIPMLENAGLVIQEKDPADGRRILVYPPSPLTLPPDQNNGESHGGVNPPIAEVEIDPKDVPF